MLVISRHCVGAQTVHLLWAPGLECPPFPASPVTVPGMSLDTPAGSSGCPGYIQHRTLHCRAEKLTAKMGFLLLG